MSDSIHAGSTVNIDRRLKGEATIVLEGLTKVEQQYVKDTLGALLDDALMDFVRRRSPSREYTKHYVKVGVLPPDLINEYVKKVDHDKALAASVGDVLLHVAISFK